MDWKRKSRPEQGDVRGEGGEARFGMSSPELMRESRRMWEEIFSEDSASFLDYYDREKCSVNWIQTRQEQGQTVSMIHWNPVRLRVGSHIVPSCYLIAVATRPPWRHRGYMAGLLRGGLEEMYRREMPFVFLMPADPAIYMPFDFRYIGWLARDVRVPAASPAADGLKICPLNPGEYREAADWLNQELSRRFSVFQNRDERYLEVLAEECASESGELCGIHSGGRLAGVFSWWEEEMPVIRELVLEESREKDRGREEILASLDARFAGNDSYRMVTTGWAGEAEPVIMGRIAHLEAFLRVCMAGSPIDCILEVSDPLIPENSRRVRWQADASGSRVTPADREPDLRVDISRLMEWAAGAAEVPEILRGLTPWRGVFLTEIV